MDALEALKLEFSLEEDEIELTESDTESEVAEEAYILPGKDEAMDQVIVALEESQITNDNTLPTAPEKKKKQRRNKDSKKDATPKEESWACNVCSTVLDTRNKLFAHIRETGHALADGQGDNGSGRGKKGKSKRR